MTGNKATRTEAAGFVNRYVQQGLPGGSWWLGSSPGNMDSTWEPTTTELLERAFADASKLPPAEQEGLDSRLLAELAAKAGFDHKIAGSPPYLRTDSCGLSFQRLSSP